MDNNSVALHLYDKAKTEIETLKAENERLNKELEIFKHPIGIEKVEVMGLSVAQIAECRAFYLTQKGYLPKGDSTLIESEWTKLIEQLRICKEALEMGAFHHNSCPWLDGKDCCCAHEKVREALAKCKEVEK